MLVLSGRTVHYLVPGCDYAIGRKVDSDVIVNCESKYGVSRQHGKLSYHINGEVLYTDTSQFGSFVGDRKIGTKEAVSSVALKVGCEIRLGLFPESWKLEQMKIVVSNLAGAQKSRVVSDAKKLGIPYRSTWDSSCTTLIMTAISTTVKVIEAVSQCRTILTPSFISDIGTAIKARTKLGPLKNYRCDITDPSQQAIRFSPNLARKTLFEHLNFVFVAAQDHDASEGLVRCLGGSPVLLDPLQPNRRDVIMAETSIVMETRDPALSTYLRSVLSERGLVPTKHADLALALFYIDKARLFRRLTDTQSSHVHDTLQVQDTQCVASQMFTQSIDMSRDLDMSRDVPMVQPSPLPSRLGKNTKTPMSVESTLPNGSFSSTATTIKPELLSEIDSKSSIVLPFSDHKPDVSMFEPSAFPPRLDKTIESPICTAKTNVSVFEPSAIPPRLDKTINSPAISSTKSPLISGTKSPFISGTKTDISFVEPSAVPPRLDRTIPTPRTTSTSSLNTSKSSYLEPSAVPPRLDKTPDNTLASTPKNVLKTPARLRSPALLETPVTPSSRVSVGSDVSLFGNSKSTPFGDSTPRSALTLAGTPRGTLTHSGTPRGALPRAGTTQCTKVPGRSSKRALLSDSDSDGEENPFATAKVKTFVFTDTLAKIHSDTLQAQSQQSQANTAQITSQQQTLQSTAQNTSQQQALQRQTSTASSAKRQKIDSAGSSTEEKRRGSSTEEKPPPGEVMSIPSSLEASSTDPGTNNSTDDPGSQSVKRELLDKTEPTNKKLKLDESKTPNITLIPDIGDNSSVWLVNTRSPKPELDRPFASLVITDVCASLIERPSSTHASRTMPHDPTVVNYKRFKKSHGVIARSMDISLKAGEFRRNAKSFFDASQPSQEQNQEDSSEEDEEAPFMDRLASKKKLFN